MPVALANGQLAAASADILGADTSKGADRCVNISLANTSGSASQTVIVTVTRSGGTARRLERFVLAANETAKIANLNLGGGDTVQGYSTDASVVDYDISLAGTPGPYAITVLDANGGRKNGTSSNSTSLTLGGDLTLAGSTGVSHEAWDASDVSIMWSGSPSRLEPDFHQRAYEVYDDFLFFDPTATVGKWVVVEDDAADTQTLVDDVAGGQLLLTAKAMTDDDGQQISYVSAPFLLAASKHLWYEARIKVAAGATQVDVIAGLCALAEDMTGVADNRFADGIGFFKSDGATTIQFGASKNGTDTGTNTSVGTLTTGWHTLGFYVNGLTSATPYLDGVAGTAITATFCDDEALAPIFMVRNGDGTIQNTLHIDYVKVIQLR